MNAPMGRCTMWQAATETQQVEIAGPALDLFPEATYRVVAALQHVLGAWRRRIGRGSLSRRGRLGKLISATLPILIVAAASCSSRRPAPTKGPPFPRQEVIAELKDFQQTLGVERTGNFERYADTPRALFRCYFTGRLELPESYEALRLIESDEPSCAVDEQAYDVFFYAIEAVAGGASPVSPALAEASLDRVLVVVPHEDFHDQREIRQASVDIGEAAATLIGFLAAGEFAKAKYGVASQVFQRLDREARLFLEKARIINAHYERLVGVYSAFRSGDITREDALARKEELFAMLKQECSAPATVPVSFNGCPAAMNNAGLAFDRTYTRYYPMFFKLYDSLDHDTRASVAALKSVLATGPKSEAELLGAMSALSP